MDGHHQIAVLIPCLNEETAIGQVVSDVRGALPEASIYVYDNASEDETAKAARQAGAIVQIESSRGKGNVVRRMFADIEADVYILIDGDGTYDIQAAPTMITKLLSEQLDLVTGVRVDERSSDSTYRRGHRMGNALFTRAVRTVFRSECGDVLSGYRVMSRRFVKSFPSAARGFEIEVEMTAHASLLRVPSGEYPTKYGDRAEGTTSKLSTYRDGRRIALALFRIYRAFAPSRFFGSLAALGTLASGAFLLLAKADDSAGVSAFTVASGIFLLLASLAFSVGVVLNAVARQRLETLRLAYLSYPSTR